MNPFHRLLAGALLACPLGAQGLPEGPPPAPASAELPPAWTLEERSAIELLRSLRRKERPSDEELCARLGKGGDRLLPLFFDILATRSMPPLDAGKPQILSEVQEQVILLAVGARERNAVLSQVEGRLALAQDPPLRLAAIGCIGAVGHGNDFPALFELALAPAEQELSRQFQPAFKRAVTAILGRDPRAFDQLVNLRRIARVELLPTLVSAVGEARDGRGLAFLSEVAYFNERLVLDVMCQVRLVGLSSDEAVNETMRVRLRRYLDESDPGTCSAAIFALTALADCDSIGTLIAMLGSENAGLRQNAHWALKTLTGLGLSPTKETWARWHQAELYWLVRSKTHEFQRLRESDPAVAADALRAILTHPLARNELVAALPELLKSRWPAIRMLACNTLAELSATSAIGKLVWTLEDPDAQVAKAAHGALCKLTHLQLPFEPLVWQAATNTEPRGAEL